MKKISNKLGALALTVVFGTSIIMVKGAESSLSLTSPEVPVDVKKEIVDFVTREPNFLKAAQQAKGLAGTNQELRRLVFEAFKKRFTTPDDAQNKLYEIFTGIMADELSKYNDTFPFALEVLKRSGANLNKIPMGTTRGFPPLHQALQLGNVALVEALIDLGAELELTDRIVGHTPLTIAVTSSNPDLTKLLIKKGANVNTRGKEGTPLEVAQKMLNRLSPTEPLTIERLESIIAMLKDNGAK